MEAPEKLYLSENIYNTFVYQVPDNDDKTQVEYVRMDIFIEKACKYLKENATYTHSRKGTEECIINIPKFIEYIKGG